MSEPQETSPGLAALIARAKEDTPDAARIGAVMTRLEASLGPLGGAVAAQAPAPVRPEPTSSSPSLTAIGGAAVITAALVLALVAWLAPPAPVRPAPRVRERPAASAGPVIPEPPPARPEPAAPSELERPSGIPVEIDRAPSGAGRASPRGTPDPVEADGAELGATEPAVADDEASSLREEVRLLEGAMAARDRGDREGARDWLTRHRARFPEGILSPERTRLEAELGDEPPVSGDPPPTP